MSAPHLGKPLMFASAEECERSFYEAMDAADIEAMAELWLDDDDVCCIHPNGPRLVGYAAVKALLTGKPLEPRLSVEALPAGSGRGHVDLTIRSTNTGPAPTDLSFSPAG